MYFSLTFKVPFLTCLYFSFSSFIFFNENPICQHYPMNLSKISCTWYKQHKLSFKTVLFICKQNTRLVLSMFYFLFRFLSITLSSISYLTDINEFLFRFSFLPTIRKNLLQLHFYLFEFGK